MNSWPVKVDPSQVDQILANLCVNARDAIAGFEKSDADDSETQWQAILHGIPERLPVSRRQWPLVKSYARQMTS